MYFKYLLLAPIGLLFNIFVITTSWFWAFPAALFKLKSLPSIFSWVHTHDDDIYGSRTTNEPIPNTFWKRYKRAVWWLCRNPGYTFDAKILGFKHEGMKVLIWSNPKPDWISGETSSLYVVMEKDGKKYFSYRRNQKLFGKRYIKMWFGWNYYSNDNIYHFLKIMFNPFKKV